MTWLIAAWRYIASSRIAQGLIVVAGIVGYHLYALGKAGRDAVKKERQKSELVAYEKRSDISESVRDKREKAEERERKRRKNRGRDALDNDW